MPNPFGTGVLEKGGDILRWALQQTGLDIDYQSVLAVAPVLNSYKFSGYIIDQELDYWTFLTKNIIPFLPIEIVNGGQGMKAVLPMLYMNRYVRPRVDVVEGHGFFIDSAIESIGDLDDITNSLRVDFSFTPAADQFGGVEYKNQLEIDQDNADFSTGFAAISEYSALSISRHGRREEILTLPFVYDFATATRIGMDHIRARALAKYEIEVRTDPEFGYLDPGDVIAITSEAYFLSGHRFQIRKKKWDNGSWLFSLLIEENPIQNDRIES